MLKRILKGVSQSSLLSAGGVGLFIATTFVNIASFAFHLVTSRQLDPSQYGALGALVGILVVFTVPSAALQVAITREVAARRADPDGNPVPIVIGPLMGNATVLGIVSTLVLLTVSPLLKEFLHLSSLMPVALLALYVLPTTIELVPKAVLLGEFRFGRVAIALMAGAFARLALAYPLTDARGLNGAMAATVLGALVTPAILLPSLRAFIKHRPDVEPLRVHWRDGTGAIVAFTGFWLLVIVDTLLARHYLSDVESGYYAAASLAARSVMFLPGAVAMVAFPRFAKGTGRSIDARRALLHSLTLVTSVGILSALIFLAAPTFILGNLFPEAYRASSGELGMLALAAAAMGSVSILMHYHLAARARIAAALPWASVVFTTIGVVFLHNSLFEIALITLISNVLLLVVMALPLFGPWSHVEGPEYDSRELWDLPDADKDLTMVVPFYNPGPLLRTNIHNIIEVLNAENASYEIIAVSDGSTDASDADLQEFGDAVRLVRLPRNQGKGAAVRTGLAMGRGRYIGFIDADGDVTAGSLHEFLALVRLYEPDIILGSKRHPMSELHYPPLRHLYSWGYQQFVRVLFHLNLRDTQTGLKLIRREVLADVLPRMVEKRFAFDLELFVVGRHLGYRRYFEAPVHIRHQFTSTVSWRAVTGTLLDTVAIYYRLHVLRFYDYTPRAKEAESPTKSPSSGVSVPT